MICSRAWGLLLYWIIFDLELQKSCCRASPASHAVSSFGEPPTTQVIQVAAAPLPWTEHPAHRLPLQPDPPSADTALPHAQQPLLPDGGLAPLRRLLDIRSSLSETGTSLAGRAAGLLGFGGSAVGRTRRTDGFYHDGRSALRRGGGFVPGGGFVGNGGLVGFTRSSRQSGAGAPSGVSQGPGLNGTVVQGAGQANQSGQAEDRWRSVDDVYMGMGGETAGVEAGSPQEEAGGRGRGEEAGELWALTEREDLRTAARPHLRDASSRLIFATYVVGREAKKSGRKHKNKLVGRVEQERLLQSFQSAYLSNPGAELFVLAEAGVDMSFVLPREVQRAGPPPWFTCRPACGLPLHSAVRAQGGGPVVVLRSAPGKRPGSDAYNRLVAEEMLLDYLSKMERELRSTSPNVVFHSPKMLFVGDVAAVFKEEGNAGSDAKGTKRFGVLLPVKHPAGSGGILDIAARFVAGSDIHAAAALWRATISKLGNQRGGVNKCGQPCDGLAMMQAIQEMAPSLDQGALDQISAASFVSPHFKWRMHERTRAHPSRVGSSYAAQQKEERGRARPDVQPFAPEHVKAGTGPQALPWSDQVFQMEVAFSPCSMLSAQPGGGVMEDCHASNQTVVLYFPHMEAKMARYFSFIRNKDFRGAVALAQEEGSEGPEATGPKRRSKASHRGMS